MSYSVSVQLTRMTNITESGRRENEHMFGYRLYNDMGYNEYVNVYETFDALIEEMNSMTVLEMVREHHPEFWETVQDEGGLLFNGEEIDIDDDDDDNYDDDSDDNDDDDDSIGQIYKDTAMGLLQPDSIILP